MSSPTSNSLETAAAAIDPASMAAARGFQSPSPRRDGFDLIDKTPIVFDQDLSRAFTDIKYHKSSRDLCARIAIDRPRVLHAFRPTTIREIQVALEDATDDINVAVIILTSTNSVEYTPAFCSGGDQTVRDKQGGYLDNSEKQPKLRVLDLQIQMRRCSKPIVAVVRGYAIGGGHILHMVADLTLASSNAVFGQSGPRMGSFDAGYGCYMATALMGSKRARELWFLCKYYSAEEALSMGLINAVFENDDELDAGTAQWVRRMVMNSPTALAACKAACNAVHDGAAGLSQMGGELTRMFYKSQEGQEGRQAFLEKRAPQFRSFM
jgi:naphthoate synthase